MLAKCGIGTHACWPPSPSLLCLQRSCTEHGSGCPACLGVPLHRHIPVPLGPRDRTICPSPHQLHVKASESRPCGAADTSSVCSLFPGGRQRPNQACSVCAKTWPSCRADLSRALFTPPNPKHPSEAFHARLLKAGPMEGRQPLWWSRRALFQKAAQ